jgi:hypothetical protein
VITARWSELGQHLLRAGAPLLAAAAAESTATALTGDLLSLETPPGRVAVLTDPEQLRVVGNACLAVFGTRLKIAARSRGGKGPDSTGVVDERQKRYLAAQQHPAVRDLMQRFEADLVGRELVDLETWLARITAERESAPRRRFAGDIRTSGLDTPADG